MPEMTHSYLVYIQTKLFNHSKRLGSECFINLKQVDLVQLPAGFLHLSEQMRQQSQTQGTFVLSGIVTFGWISYLTAFLMAGIGPVPMTDGSRPT